MAYGQFTGYVPAPQPGAYHFQQTDGRNILLNGPAAESLKARLDASAAMAPQPTADNSVIANAAKNQAADAESFGAAMHGLGNWLTKPQGHFVGRGGVPLPTATDATQAAPAAAPIAAPPPHAPDTVPVSIARPPEGAAPTGAPEGAGEAAPPPAAPSAHPYMVNGVNTGIIQGPDGRLYQHAPGVAAVTPAQLQAKAASGVALPHSMSESVSGGFTPSQDFLDMRSNLAEQKGMLIDETAKIEAANAGREQELARQQAAMAAQMKAEEQARADQIAAQVQKDLETKDRLQKEYGSARVNPQRLFSGPGGTARAVLAALSAGLGQAGAGLQAMGGHPTQNTALMSINSAIDRDIAAQETEIKVKGDMANNALAQYQRSGMSLESARSALRATQLGWVAAQNQLSASMTKGAMVQTNAAMMQNGLQGALNDANEQYRQQSLGNATKSVAEQVVYPHGASGGGFTPLSSDKTLSVIEKGQDVESKTATTAKTIGEIGKSGAAKGQDAQAVEATIATADDSLQRLKAYKPNEVPLLQENRGAIPRAWNATKDFFAGEGTAARGMPQHESELIQDTEAVRGQIKALTSVLSKQGALSGPESVEANKGLAPGATVGELMRSLGMLRERAQAIKARE